MLAQMKFDTLFQVEGSGRRERMWLWTNSYRSDISQAGQEEAVEKVVDQRTAEWRQLPFHGPDTMSYEEETLNPELDKDGTDVLGEDPAADVTDTAAAAQWAPHLITDGFSAASIGGPVTFPPPTGLNVNMMPIVLGMIGSVPDELLPYANMLTACPLPLEDFGKVGYLTVHESVIEDDQASQRRAGLHAEGGYLAPAGGGAEGGGEGSRAVGGQWEAGDAGVQPLTIAWGRGTYSRDGSQVGQFEGGIFMASNASRSTRVWNTRVRVPNPPATTVVGALGDLEHMRPALGRGHVLRANELVWMTDATPHESLPLPRGTARQYFRLVTHDVSVWYEAHNTPNPLGVRPGADVAVVGFDKFAVPVAEDVEDAMVSEAGHGTDGEAESRDVAAAVAQPPSPEPPQPQVASAAVGKAIASAGSGGSSSSSDDEEEAAAGSGGGGDGSGGGGDGSGGEVGMCHPTGGHDEHDEGLVSLATRTPSLHAEEEAAACACGIVSGSTFDLETLQAGCPAGVEPTAKHLALSDADFETVFKASKAEFGTLPAWKQASAKKAVGLF